MKKKIYFLKDGPISWLEEIALNSDDYNFKFYNVNINYNKNQKRLVRILSVHKVYLSLAFKTVKKVKNEDLIVCWLDLIGFYTYIFLFLFGKKNKILVLNLMVNNDGSIISNLKKYLFQNFLNNKNNYFTLTSNHLQNLYFDYFPKCNRSNFFILNDTYEDLFDLIKKESQKINKNSIFCGGRNSRDWNVAFQIAKMNPKFEFIYVVPSKDVVPKEVSKNIKLYENITKSKFNTLISSCSIVILPLNTDAPAGLIVLYLAGLLKKALIISDSLSIRDYIVNDENGIVIKNPQIDNFNISIRKLIEDHKHKNKLSKSLFETVVKKGSPERFFLNLLKIINLIQKK